MDTPTPDPVPRNLGIVDAIARVCHLWVRHLEPDSSRWNDVGHLAFLGGLISGLCHRLDQQRATESWVAYAYALLDGHAGDALRSARRVLAATNEAGCRGHFERGLREAASIVTMISLPTNDDA